jgi:hypothetical protein
MKFRKLKIAILASTVAHICIAEPASAKTWYLRMTGGGFTGVAIEMKSKTACEKTKRSLLYLDRHRQSVPADKTVAQGRCFSEMPPRN